MCRSMADIRSTAAEIRRGKKRRKKKKERNYRMKILWSALLHRATINSVIKMTYFCWFEFWRQFKWDTVQITWLSCTKPVIMCVRDNMAVGWGWRETLLTGRQLRTDMQSVVQSRSSDSKYVMSRSATTWPSMTSISSPLLRPAVQQLHNKSRRS